MKLEQLRFNDTHEWVGICDDCGENLAVVGITDFALQQLTDLVYMELPAIGAQVTRGEQFGEVESVKAVSPLYSPVTGEVVAVHQELTANLENMASDPFGSGWLMKVRLHDQGELANLLDRTAYLQQCAQ